MIVCSPLVARIFFLRFSILDLYPNDQQFSETDTHRKFETSLFSLSPLIWSTCGSPSGLGINDTATNLCTYKGTVDGIEGDFGTKQQVLVTQTCKYDGYIYLGYGTWGHNFFVVDLDDEDKTWSVVGRIYYRYHNADGSVFYLEPQFVALRGGKIVTGSRDFGAQSASILEFDK